MKTIVVVHFNPIEKYPPAFNLLRVLAESKTGAGRIILISTDPGPGKSKITIPGVRIYRVGGKITTGSKLRRLVLYTVFIIKTFGLLVRYHPGAVLYYETLSAGGPWLYLKLKKAGCSIFCCLL